MDLKPPEEMVNQSFFKISVSGNRRLGKYLFSIQIARYVGKQFFG